MAKIPLKGLEDNINKFARIGLNRAAERVKERLEKNAGLTDHTLDELAALGHPYSARRPQKIHNPDYLVHTQSGRLKDNIKITQEDKDNIAIGVDPLAVPYFLDVVEGIPSKMVPRDFPFFTLQELENEKIIENTIEAAINEGIKRS